MDALKKAPPAPLKDQGQATVEYILLLAIVVAGFMIVFNGLGSIGLMSHLMTPISDPFAKAYQNGHYQARAPDDPGGAYKHPRALPAPESFRIFYSQGDL
jgi:hypothetical protein